MRAIRQGSLAAGVAAALAVAAVLAPPRAAHAQGSAARDAAAARALFQEGVACADRDDWVCAADRFARAHALRSSPVIAYNLGHALVELGRLVEGAEMLQQATRDESASAQVRADARRMVEALTPRIGRLTLHVHGPTEGVSIRIGELEIPEALHGTAQPIDPGSHAITAVRGGEVVATTSVDVAEGGAIEAELTIPDPPPEPDSAEIDRADGTRLAVDPGPGSAIGAPPPESSDEGLWIGLGIGGAVLVVGAAIVIGVVLAQPHDATPFGGNLGTVDVGP